MDSGPFIRISKEITCFYILLNSIFDLNKSNSYNSPFSGLRAVHAG